MKLFISWSGEESREYAELLQEFLPQFIQILQPWISVNIEKGSIGEEQIFSALSNADAVLFCFTKTNLKSHWMHFEAGVFAGLQSKEMYTVLFDLDPKELYTPFSNYQATVLNETDFKKLIFNLNNKLPDCGFNKIKDETLEYTFNTVWEKFSVRVNLVREEFSANQVQIKKNCEEYLEEIYQLIKANSVKNESIPQIVNLEKDTVRKKDLYLLLEVLEVGKERTQIKFNIRLINKSQSALELAGMQFGLTINDGIILDNRTLLELDSQNSQLSNKIQSPKIGRINLESRQIRIPAVPAVGAGNGSFVPTSIDELGIIITTVTLKNIVINRRIEPIMEWYLGPSNVKQLRTTILLYLNRINTPLDLNHENFKYRHAVTE